MAVKRHTKSNLLYWSTYPLDRMRRWILFRFRAILAPLMSDRPYRIFWTMMITLPLIGIFSWSAPLWQLLLGPILLGIPHLVGDVRYLVIHQQLHRKKWFWVGVAFPFFLYVVFQKPYLAMSGVVIASAFSVHTHRHWIQGFAVLGLFLSYIEPYLFIFALLHAHNLIALWIWWRWRRNRALWEAIPILLCFLILFGLCFMGPSSWAFSLSPDNLSYDYFVINLVPVYIQQYAQEIILSYAFLQSVHYLVWIRLIPEEARKQPSPRSFFKSAVYLKRDFGTLLFTAILIGAIFLLAWGLYTPKEARLGYLTLISFHGFLELAFLCYNSEKI